MSELKPCPFCGRTPQINTKKHPFRNYDITGIGCQSCGTWDFEINIGKFSENGWNARPLEDALQKRIDELTHKNEVLMDSYLESETINDKGELAGSLQYFRQRIADLEAENKALKLIAGSHSMSELRRLQMQTGWFKYPPGEEK